MAIQRGPKLNTSGLILLLDANNLTSYPGSGTTWTDLSGNNYNGTLTNGPTTSSLYGTSISFDGTNDYIAFNNSGSVTPFDFGTGDMTCMFWMLPSTWGDTSRGVISKKASDATNGWVIYSNTTTPTKISARIGLTRDLTSSGSVSTSIFQCWTLTRSSSTVSWYLNGVLDATATNSTNVSDTTVELQIGRSQTWAGHFKGDISNLMFYSRALSAAEILDNYNNTKIKFASNFMDVITTDGLLFSVDAGNVSSYPGSGTTWTDLSGNGNNFTLTSGTAYDSNNRGSLIFDSSKSASRSVVSTSTTITMEIWFKVTTYAETALFYNGNGASSGYGFAFGACGASTSTLFIYFGGINCNVVSKTNIALNTWYHAVYTRTTNSNTLYINGVSVSTSSSNPTAPGAATTTFLGAITGNIAIARMYNRVLSAAEVAKNYNAVKDRFGL